MAIPFCFQLYFGADMTTKNTSNQTASQNKNSISARMIRPFLLAILAGGLASCASIDSTSTKYAGAPHYPPSNPGKVEILRTPPTQAHQRIGEVVVDSTIDPSPPISDVEERLRAEAAKIGADAIVVVADRVEPEPFLIQTGYRGEIVESYTGHKLVGVAIKYQYQMAPTGKPAEQEQLTPTGKPIDQDQPVPVVTPVEKP
jgi:hypothetical protein